MSKTYLEIEASEAVRRLDGYHVVDVRQPEEFIGELGHIAGSRLVPLGDLVERLQAGHPPADIVGAVEAKTWLLVCRSGNRSGQACARLVDAGITAVVNLAGGMLEWNRAGLPVHRDPPGDAGDPTG